MRFLIALGLAVSAPTIAAAQSLLDRPPNISADWVANEGTIQFNFLHRFTRSAAPERKVSNFPTFIMGIGLPRRTMLGFAYATNSTLASRFPNEWEFFLRHALLSEAEGAPIDLGGQIGYNLASDGADGEISIAKRGGPIRVVGVGRVLANPFAAGKTQLAVGGGAVFRLSTFLALGGDVTTITNKQAGQTEKLAWSGGLHLAIPNTPHTLSFQATNTNTTTLQGLSRGEDRIRYGFEFTIPLTLARYFGRRPPPDPEPSTETPAAPPPTSPSQPRIERPATPVDTTPPPPAAVDSTPADPSPATRTDSIATPRGAEVAPNAANPPAKPAAPKSVRAVMKGLAYLPKRIEITAGTVLVWRNDDPLAHTVTAADKSFDSGLIQGGATWRRAFSKPGTYQITCTPHPFMKATIVVKAAP